ATGIRRQRDPVNWQMVNVADRWQHVGSALSWFCHDSDMPLSCPRNTVFPCFAGSNATTGQNSSENLSLSATVFQREFAIPTDQPSYVRGLANSVAAGVIFLSGCGRTEACSQAPAWEHTCLRSSASQWRDQPAFAKRSFEDVHSQAGAWERETLEDTGGPK